MKTVRQWLNETTAAHRLMMAEVAANGLRLSANMARLNLLDAKKVLAEAQKLEQLDVGFLRAMVEEFARDHKTLESRLNPTIADAADFAAIYGKHPWSVDYEVYIYDDSDLTESEADMYAEAITKTLRGEFRISLGGCGDRGFGFFAEDADWDKLGTLLDGLEKRGCIVEAADWDEWKHAE